MTYYFTAFAVNKQIETTQHQSVLYLWYSTVLFPDYDLKLHLSLNNRVPGIEDEASRISGASIFIGNISARILSLYQAIARPGDATCFKTALPPPIL